MARQGVPPGSARRAVGNRLAPVAHICSRAQLARNQAAPR